MRLPKLLFFSIFCCLLSSFHNAFAAIPFTPAELLPSSIQQAPTGTQVSPPPIGEKPTPALPSSAPSPSSALPPAAAKIKFKLNHIVITGNTVYSQAQLENIYKKYLGTTISLVDLQNITDSITKRYREDGYLLSKAVIPAQKINSGVVRLQVIEGYISNVNVAGYPGNARSLLEGYGKHLTEQRPITISTLERYVLLANDTPGLDVKTVLSPAKNTPNQTVSPGATDATLIADLHKANGYVSYDNRGTWFLGPQEVTYGGSINSLFRAGDQTNAQVLLTSQTNELQYFRLGHQTPLGSNGWLLNLSAIYSVTNPDYTLAQFNVTGRYNAYSLGVSYPYIRSREKTSIFSAVLDSSNNISNIGPGDTGFNLYTDKIRSLRVGNTFSNADSWRGVNQMGAQLSQGLPIFNNSPLDQTGAEGFSNLSRTDGHSVYSKINLDASRVQFLGATNFSILAAMQGQYALFNRPLLVAEQFAFGGAQFGQAYDPAQFTGDHGLAGKVEVRYDQDLNWRIMNHFQIFTFYDVGKVWNILGNTPGVPVSGASTGFGARLQFLKYLSGYLEWAQPLTAPAGAQLTKAPRIFFSITLAGDTGSSMPAPTAQQSPPPVPAAAIYSPL